MEHRIKQKIITYILIISAKIESTDANPSQRIL